MTSLDSSAVEHEDATTVLPLSAEPTGTSQTQKGRNRWKSATWCAATSGWFRPDLPSNLRVGSSNLSGRAKITGSPSSESLSCGQAGSNSRPPPQAAREFDNLASPRAKLDARAASARAVPSVSEGRAGAAREQSLRARENCCSGRIATRHLPTQPHIQGVQGLSRFARVQSRPAPVSRYPPLRSGAMR